MNPSLYLVTDGPLSKRRAVDWIVAQALKGGVTMVQLREKEASTRDFLALAEKVLALTRPSRVPLLINDRVDVALAVDADGVHLGQNDMDYAVARRLLGPDKIIGLSVESVEQAEAAQSIDVDYLGVSPIYRTPTKEELRTAIGIDGLRRIKKFTRHLLVAIGGMNKETIPDVVRAGADGIAVVSAICSSDDPRLSAEELINSISEVRNEANP